MRDWMKYFVKLFFLCLAMLWIGAPTTYAKENKLYIINDTPTAFRLKLKIRVVRASWESTGGIGHIVPAHIATFQNGKGFLGTSAQVAGRRVNTVKNSRSKDIFIDRYCKGAIWSGKNICWDEAKAVYELEKPLEIKINILGRTYTQKKDKHEINLLPKGKHYRCEDFYAVIRPRVKETGEWLTDEQGNYVYFAEHYSRDEFNKYWEKHGARIERENQRLDQKKEDALKRQLEQKK